ncbi:putative O-methyltransferase [Aspergillus brunneoviolaceus CBS 621.78]|uniref:O-methyltransferase n=1 Tax=Aspergillus brunneoviolaceus CBS 621.78 TaxID=1450534 RepID=A0ACD1GA95_9EURO|nr:putative O-methyltransferase [Aspergillus brunneoviolaceus CBS 621.78]RAH46160.1 putative O-methyltransferase [Aspergillus brunneoviolaceus CBS 621.78]
MTRRALEQLIDTIAVNGEVLKQQVRREDHDSLENCLADPCRMNGDASKARLAVIDASKRLVRLVTGPYDLFYDMMSEVFQVGAIRALMNFGIPQLIPLHEPLAAIVLELLSGLGRDPLRRLIRYTASYGFLQEVEPEMFGHTPLSALCVHDSVATRSCMWNLNVTFPVASKIYEGLKVDPSASDNTRCAASVAYASPEKQITNIWDYHRSYPKLELGFHDYINATTRSAYYSALHAVRGFDWSSVQTVVDIGGSSGHVSMALTEAHPHLHCIFEDLPDVISESRQTLPPAYADKIEYLTHSFFEPQPVASADYFLLRFVLHNWSDEDVCRIIANLSPALRPGMWVLIADIAVPEIGSSSGQVEAIVRCMDCRMLALFGGRERTKNDIVALVQGVDTRLAWKSCTQPEGSMASFLAFQCV